MSPGFDPELDGTPAVHHDFKVAKSLTTSGWHVTFPDGTTRYDLSEEEYRAALVEWMEMFGTQDDECQLGFGDGTQWCTKPKGHAGVHQFWRPWIDEPVEWS